MPELVLVNDKQLAFLAAYSQVGNITRAAELAEIDRKTHYYWLNNDPTYPERFTEAHESACDRLELEARRRAQQGTAETVYYQGVVVGEKMVYSDSLLALLLRAHRPEKFGHPGRVPTVEVTINVDALDSRIEGELAAFLAGVDAATEGSVPDAVERGGTPKI